MKAGLRTLTATLIVLLQPQITLANDERTFFGKCAGIETRRQAVMAVLPGHWYYSKSETWDVASVSVAPSGRTYESYDCIGTADVEADIRIASKVDSINGGLGATYKFRRSQPRVSVSRPESRSGWDRYCRPNQEEMGSIIDNDGRIQFSTVVTEKENGFCDLNIEGSVLVDGKSKIYTFKLIDETTLTQFRGDFERIYRKTQ